MEPTAVAPIAEPTRARIVAVVRSMCLDAVIEQLVPVAPSQLMIEQVRGYGRQKEHLQFYEEVGTWQGSFLPKVRLEFTVRGSAVPAAVDAVCRGARTGRVGDGKIFVQAVHGPVAAGGSVLGQALAEESES